MASLKSGKGGGSTADIPQAKDDVLSLGAQKGFSITLDDLLANDLGGDDKHFYGFSATSTNGATLKLVDGCLVYEPNGTYARLGAGETGTDTFTYTIQMGDGRLSTATVTLNLIGQNDGPIFAVGSAQSVAVPVVEIADGTSGENTTIHQAGDSFSFTDADLRDTHTVSVKPHGEGYVGTFTPALTEVNGSGTVAWSFKVADHTLDFLAEGQTIVQTYDITVSDSQGGMLTQTVSITLTGSNDAPIAEALSTSVMEHGSTTLRAVVTDVDVQDTHAFSLDTTGTLGSVVDHGDGVFVYDAGNAFDWLGTGETATDTFHFAVEDGHGGVTIQTATITVKGENDAPVIAAADEAQAVSIDERLGIAGDTSVDAVKGAIHATDVDLSDKLTASVGEQTVLAMDAGGNAIALTDAQIAGIKAAFHLNAHSDDGTFDWYFATQDRNLDFLGTGDKIVLTTSVVVSDYYGGLDRATVSIKLNGAADASPGTVGAPVYDGLWHV